MSAMLFVGDVDPRMALFVAVAIRRARDSASYVPDGVVDLEHWFTEIAQRASHQEPPGAATRPPVPETGPVSEFLTLSEAAELTGVSERTLERRLSEGKLPSVKVGRSRRFRRADLERFMEDAQ